MIKSIEFKNFRVLRDAILPLNRFTLIVGPNGSGKSTAMQALSIAHYPSNFHYLDLVSTNLQDIFETTIEIRINWAMTGVQWDATNGKIISEVSWARLGNHYDSGNGPVHRDIFGQEIADDLATILNKTLAGFMIFSFEAHSISEPVALRPNMKLLPDGANLAGVLDNLRDSDPERFTGLNEELGRWLPEFDQILFETTKSGKRAFILRTHVGKHRIKASDLSHGTLFALAFLTLAYIPNPPSIVCFEEPERGIHPRLLSDIRDSMYRLAYPEDYGEKRNPVQVIATTHSPYMLDLYKDHPEEVVIAHKDEQGVRFERLSEKPNFDEFLQNAPLGEVWYSGILGGVPSKP